VCVCVGGGGGGGADSSRRPTSDVGRPVTGDYGDRRRTTDTTDDGGHFLSSTLHSPPSPLPLPLYFFFGGARSPELGAPRGGGGSVLSDDVVVIELATYLTYWHCHGRTISLQPSASSQQALAQAQALLLLCLADCGCTRAMTRISHLVLPAAVYPAAKTR
jgi:hypothetical protein